METGMFETILTLFTTKPKTAGKKRPAPLRMSIEYKSVPAPTTFFTNLPPDLVSLYKDAQQKLPDATLTIYDMPKGTRLIGFTKPKIIGEHYIYYGEDALHKDGEQLFTDALKKGSSIAVFSLKEDQKCVQVNKQGKTSFLLKPDMLEWRSWSYTPNPVITPEATLRPR